MTTMAKMTEMLADLASGVLLSDAQVTEVSRYSPRFTRIELQSDAFRSGSWTPGAKLQLRPRRGTLGMRTYTPTRWDPESGTTQLIAFIHGDGPAARWFRLVQAGDTCEVFGPRRSIELGDVSAGAVFVGDETGVGLACALRPVSADARYVFEASDAAELTDVLADVGLADRCTVVGKDVGRARLLGEAREAADAADTAGEPCDLVVSGDAATVHTVRRDTRQWPRTPRRIRAKAYWAHGKTGLD